jgi:chromate transporter
LADGVFQAVFLGVQPAVIALILRACHRLGRNCLTDLPLGIIAAVAAIGDALGMTFWFTLAFAGLSYVAATLRRWIVVIALAVPYCVTIAAFSPVLHELAIGDGSTREASPQPMIAAGSPAPVTLFGSGLRAGLLTFGGAYTAIPFLKKDAVENGRWMTERDFLDGLALSGILPAPLIIFSTFVGFFGGGFWGALAMTFGVFLPAFCLPILLHRHLAALIQNAPLRHFLEGVTAGVIGLIFMTTLRLAGTAISSGKAAVVCAVALAILYAWKSKLAVPIVMLGAGAAGAWIFAGVSPAQ